MCASALEIASNQLQFRLELLWRPGFTGTGTLHSLVIVLLTTSNEYSLCCCPPGPVSFLLSSPVSQLSSTPLSLAPFPSSRSFLFLSFLISSILILFYFPSSGFIRFYTQNHDHLPLILSARRPLFSLPASRPTYSTLNHRHLALLCLLSYSRSPRLPFVVLSALSSSENMVIGISKRGQLRNERALQDLIRTVPGNDRCADCQAMNPGMYCAVVPGPHHSARGNWLMLSA